MISTLIVVCRKLFFVIVQNVRLSGLYVVEKAVKTLLKFKFICRNLWKTVFNNSIKFIHH